MTAASHQALGNGTFPSSVLTPVISISAQARTRGRGECRVPLGRRGRAGGAARTCLRASRCCSCCCRFHWLCWMSSSMDGVPWAGATGAAGASGGWGRGGRVAAGSSSGACCLQMTGRRGGEAAPVRGQWGSRYPLGSHLGSSPPYTHPPEEDPCNLSQLRLTCLTGPGPGTLPLALSLETFGMVISPLSS